MAKRRARPKTPEQIAHDLAQARADARRVAKDPREWGADGEALSLPANAEVTIIHDDRKRVQTAHRADVFARLFSRKGLTLTQLAAARRLEADLATARGEGDRGMGGDGSAELVTGAMIKASRDATAALLALPSRDGRMMLELMEPKHVHTSDPLNRWRLVVGWATGVRDKEAQAHRVREASQALAVHYGMTQAVERAA
jgi:hypothetical protein